MSDPAIPTAAKNAAFLVLATEIGGDVIYSPEFVRALDRALEAAAPHMLALPTEPFRTEIRDANGNVLRTRPAK